ncbi:M28 family peptidase [Membranihabitans maritimus]|uniref:M28 family peptidase n=1 Tax=Membranihabitans maritimus TaxID=2904244 RepID=UPI001F3C49D7|nr:M28 family peptidase [Membranihabitans maritimus]
MKYANTCFIRITVLVLFCIISLEIYSQTDTFDLNTPIARDFMKEVTPANFKKHLIALSSHPHRAGTEANLKVAEYISAAMEMAGFTSKMYPYDIYMPKGPGTARISIITPERIPLNNRENIIEEDIYSSHPDLDFGWNAYSGEGKVTGEIVYANYGRKEDFEKLKELGVSLEGKIAIARYGGNFRGYKAKFAEEYGAVGLIMYTDPEDAGYMKGLTYPEGPYSNGSTIQRGSVLTLDYTGDPLTPLDPALPLDHPDSPERLNPDDIAFHTIPVAPLGYGSAREILERMTGSSVPTAWQGGLPFTYRIEGGEKLSVQLEVEQAKEFLRVQNVIGTMEGTEFPDEWIILGCHYDAWSFGTTDPNSGTAMLLAMADALGKLKKQGWRPKRSILIGHWDAEEYGILGSAEWVEQMKDELSANTLAYINADAACAGIRFSAASSPSLKRLIYQASSATQYQDTDLTVREHWTQNQKKEKGEIPDIGNLGGGSDHIGFYSHLGIPSMGASMWNPTLYHSNYDNLAWFDKFGDTTYQNGATLGKVLGNITLLLSENDVVPYDLSQYGTDLEKHIESIKKLSIKNNWEKQLLNPLLEKAEEIEKAGAFIDSLAHTIDRKNISKINSQLIDIERTFLSEKGMPFGSWYRSIYACSDPFSGYAAWMLPELRYYIETDDLADFKKAIDRHMEIFERLENRLSEIHAFIVN